jgi:hypothetical protein
MAVLLLFLLPANLLFALGIGYDVTEGFIGNKIHPATYLTTFGLVATLMAVLQRKPVAGLAEWRVPIIYILLTVLCAMCSFVSVGTAGATNYIDTFVAAGILAMILATGDHRQRRILGYVLMAFVLSNIMISFWESVSQTHLIPTHVTKGVKVRTEDNDFRPSGMYSHPLVAACVTSMAIFLLFSMRLSPWRSGIVLALLVAGLFSFGGRSSLAITSGILVAAGVMFLLMKLVRRALTARILSLALLAVLLLPLLLILLGTQTNIGTRVVTHFYVDDSAMVRVAQWDVLDLLSLVYLARLGGWPFGWMLVGTFLAIASTSNSLGVKTSDLSFLAAFAFAMSGFRDQRSDAASELKVKLQAEPAQPGFKTGQFGHRGLGPNIALTGNRPLLQR